MMETIYYLAAGGVAGMVAKTAIAPFERVKIIYQTTSIPFTLKDAAKTTLCLAQEEGPLSLWKGHSTILLRIIPFSAIQFYSHDKFVKFLGDSGGNGGGRQILSAIGSFGAGAMAGTVATLATYPLDLFRARLAVQRDNTLMYEFRTARNIGMTAMFRGIGPTLAGIIPYSGTSFCIYGILKEALADSDGKINSTTRFLSGAVSGLIGQSVAYPLDIIRRRMQIDHLQESKRIYQTVRTTFAHIIAHEGTKGLFKGLSMNWIKGPVASGLSFTCYDFLSNYYINNIAAT